MEQTLNLKHNFLDEEWILEGDFNVVKNRREKVGRSVRGLNLECFEFSDFIKDIGLVDSPCKGKRFSWVRGERKAKNRLDQFLISANIMDWWGVVGQLIGFYK